MKPPPAAGRDQRRRREAGGRRAEALAALYLRLKGYKIIARRYKSPVGEVDLICLKGEWLVFVEVKKRGSLSAAAESLLPRQIGRIERAAAAFLGRNAGFLGHNCRIDALLLAPWRWPRHLKAITD